MVSIGYNVFNLAKYGRKQIIDTTIKKTGNSIGHFLPSWKLESNDISSAGKFTSFIRATKSNSPTPNLISKSIRPIGFSLMSIETSANNFGDIVF